VALLLLIFFRTNNRTPPFEGAFDNNGLATPKVSSMRHSTPVTATMAKRSTALKVKKTG
jgi:hypothetical protein